MFAINVSFVTHCLKTLHFFPYGRYQGLDIPWKINFIMAANNLSKVKATLGFCITGYEVRSLGITVNGKELAVFINLKMVWSKKDF